MSNVGIKKREANGRIAAVHGLDKTDEARIFRTAKNRCENPRNKDFCRYGGRGIKFKFGSLTAFIEHVGRRPTRQHSLDRIDPNGHYAPGNVRWATIETQSNNRRTSKMLTHNGVTMSQAQWARKIGMSGVALRERLKRMSVADAITSPKERYIYASRKA